jgi:hypothetical protein
MRAATDFGIAGVLDFVGTQHGLVKADLARRWGGRPLKGTKHQISKSDRCKPSGACLRCRWRGSFPPRPRPQRYTVT